MTIRTACPAPHAVRDTGREGLRGDGRGVACCARRSGIAAEGYSQCAQFSERLSGSFTNVYDRDTLHALALSLEPVHMCMALTPNFGRVQLFVGRTTAWLESAT